MFKLWKLWAEQSGDLCPSPDASPKKSNICLVALLALPALLGSWQTAAAEQSPVVQTKDGPVQGLLTDGVAQFLGIPYAAPPVGKLRWKPPKKPEPWTEVLQATKYAPICALTTTLGVFSGPANDNEDCLYLNVFTPNLDDTARLPVIVWIHGGGNVDGETPGYDGSKLAADGKTVVVTMEYRLNLMGFFAHPALDNEGHPFANYGILDQQAVLKWVKQNIAKFGGDKNNVTLGGQSAGAQDTGLNMVSPLAAGLFDRAICESYCPRSALPTKEAAEANGVAMAVAAGCGAGTGPEVAKCLRDLPASTIEAFAGTASAASTYISGQGIVDGEIVPDQPLKLFANGQFNHMPLINGNVEDEQNFSLAITEYFTSPKNALRTPPTADQYEAYINTTFVPPAYPAGSAPKVLANYPLNAYASPQLAWDRLGTDVGICSERRLDKILASQIPVYAYEFDDQTAPFYFPKMPGFTPLAYHTADIQYLFPLWSGGPDGIQHQLNQKQKALSDQLVTAWTNFAWTGNPNGIGNYPWPKYTIQNNAPAWLIEDIPVLSTLTDAQYSALRKCDFWDSLVVMN